MNSQATSAVEPLLSVENLTVDYAVGRKQTKRVTDGISFSIAPGQTLGLVGESGSGKSTVGKALLGLAPVTGGEIRFAGKRSDPSQPRSRQMLKDMQMVFQDPYSALDPTKTIGYSIAEPLRAFSDEKLGRTAVATRVGDMLERVGLPAEAASRYPAQFSGGQRQRIVIARALIVEPKLLICDEVVSALDLSIQAQILNLLNSLQREKGLSYLFISHDLGVVRQVSENVLVLYRGRIMEAGPVGAVHDTPSHPYSKALVAAAPMPDPAGQNARRELRRRYLTSHGAPLPLVDNCAFQHRCPFVIDRCATARPEPRRTTAGAMAACHRIGDEEARAGALVLPAQDD